MRFLTFFIVSIIAVVTLAAKAKQPNVIVLITDDQGYGDMSCHGHPVLKTPELDRLHDEGVRLTDFHVDPTCAPTRAALMTGQYSAKVGVWLTFGSRHHMRRGELTMAEVFQQNGYETAIFGKWHLGDNYPFRPMDRGFDESLIHGGGVISETPDFWDNNYYDDTYSRNGEPEKVEGYCTDVWFNETIDFVEKNQDKPFFVYLSTNAPHGPLHVPESYRQPYLKEKGRTEFLGMIANIDENIGKLRTRLQELSLDRDTIFVFLNDNGTNGGALTHLDDGTASRNGWTTAGYNAGMRGRKVSHYEGGHRAACFMYWPNGDLVGGRDVDGVTAHIDLLPTFVELCDLKVKGRSDFDGVSLADVLSGGNDSALDRSVVVHNQARFNQPVGKGELIKYQFFSVMKDDWRLVGPELYNLSDDPAQRRDVAAQYPELVQSMKADYEKWWENISQYGNAFCPFVINPKKQETVVISSQNLLGAKVAYSQRSVRKGEGGEGWTVIDVEKPGVYKIGMRRWPRESGLAIGDAAGAYPMDKSTHKMMKIPQKVFDPRTARLQVGDFDETQKVEASDEEIVFEVKLKKGEQRIQTCFTMADGMERAAYYTYIETM
ncbi:arylsulfatase [Pelagicoccus mobilis]|uniref:Arylsulfatase n=1 Tax=Pelagicoccus mobilis TaxID=415221 RepID=A0A934RYC9_9BACT|nr:arylsulfatase [Pelagicoccus mobilis]MBK1875793.1 arylsulfatase [Pelagicoccus mobilis]